jgi:TP901 family phage tail tape measure protein
MARIELNIVALGDFASVNTQIKALQAQVDLLNKSVIGVGLGPQLTKDLASANAAFKATMLSTGQFTAQTVTMASETEKFGAALVAGKLKLSDYFNIITGKSSQATASLKALAAEQVKLQNSIIMADPTKKGLFSVYTPTTINAIADATKIATMEQNLYNLSLEASSKALINWGKNTQWAGRQLTVGLTMPMVMFGAAAVKSFKDTNIELTRLQRLYGLGLTPPSQAQLNAISGDVLKLGKQIAETMGIAQTETVKVAANFAAMGKMGNDLLTITAQTQRLAKLGAVDSAQATTAIVSLQNVYRVSTNDLAEAVNFLSDMQKQTTMTLGDMTDAIPRVGPIMQQLGGSYKDTAVMLLAMKEAGVPAAQAANALKSAFASIIAPTKAATTEAAKFGISLDLVKNAGTPVQMIEKLQAAMAKLTPLAREQLIEKIFGKFQFARISALLDNFGRAGSQTQNALKVAGATSAELAKLANQEMTQATMSTTAKWQRAIETFKATLYPVGQKFLEIGTMIVNFAEKIGKAFSGLPGPVKTILGIFAGGAALAGPLIMLTGLLANFAGYILKGVVSIRQLASGGKSFKELLTPEIIASQNAAAVFGAEIDNDVKSVDLLSEAIKRLTVALEGMAGAINVGTGEMGIAAAASKSNAMLSAEEFSMLPMARPATMAYNKSPNKIRAATFQKSHVSEASVVSYEEAQLMLLDDQVSASAKAIINAAVRDVRLGITSVEDFALMRLSNFVTDLTAAANQGLKVQNGGYAKSRLINEELNASVYGTNFAQLQARGIAINEEAAARLTAAMNQTVKDVLILDEEFKSMDVVTDVELTKAFQRALQMLTENIDLLDVESQKLLMGFNQLNAERNVLYGKIGASAMNGFAPYEYAGASYAGGAALGTYAPRSGAIYAGQGDYQLSSLTAKAKAITAEIEAVWAKAGLEIPKVYVTAMEKGFVALQAEEIKAGTVAGEVQSTAMIKAIESNFVGLAPAMYERITAETSMFNLTAGEAAGEEYSLGFMSRVNRALAKPTTAMGIGIGSMMLGSSISNIGGGKNAVANTAGSVVSNVGMTAMMSSFLPAAGTELLGGALVMPELAPLLLGVAAVTVAYKGLSTWLNNIKVHNNEVAASFKASNDAISMFGGTMTNITQANYNFGTGVSQSGQEINQAGADAAAIKALPDTNSLKMVSDLVKGQKSPGETVSTLTTFLSAQVASGLPVDKVNQMVTAILAYADKSNLLSTTLQSVGKTTKDVTTATQTWLDALQNQGDGAISAGSTYKQLADGQKAYADGILQVTNSISSASTPTNVVIAQLKVLGSTSQNTTDAVNGLALALANVGQSGAAANVSNWGNQLGLNMPEIQYLLKMNNAGINVDLPKNFKGSNADKKAWIEKNVLNTPNLTAILTAQDKAGVDSAKSGLDAAKASLSAIQAQAQGDTGAIKLLKDKKAILDANLKTMQKQTSELKAQQQFQISQLDLDNQIRMANASGNFLQAAMLQQQKNSNAVDYAQGTKVSQMQEQSNLLGDQITALQAAADLAKQNAANAAAVAQAQAQVKAAQIAYDAAVKAAKTDNIKQQVLDLLALFGLKPPTNSSTGGTSVGPDAGAAEVTGKNLGQAAQAALAAPQSKRTLLQFADLPDTMYVEFSYKGKTYVADQDTGTNVYSYDPATKQHGKRINDLSKAATGTDRARAGMPVVVGDGGRPEVFVPYTDGAIIPNLSMIPNLPSFTGAAFKQPSFNMPANVDAGAVSGTIGMSTFNINVTVNNEDAQGIANTIMDTIKRQTAMTSTDRRLVV